MDNMTQANEKGRLQGTMYLAKKPCGKVCVAGWYEAIDARSIAMRIASWRETGYTVETVARYHNDTPLKWSCRDSEPCACRDAG